MEILILGNFRKKAEAGKLRIPGNLKKKAEAGKLLIQGRQAADCMIKIIGVVLLFLAAALSCLPVFFLAVMVFTGEQELSANLQGVLTGQGRTVFALFPMFPTLRGVVELLLDTPEFYVVFWNSVKITAAVLAGQLAAAAPAAWAFSRWRGKISSLLFYIYTVLMLLPFQVTMLPSYLVIDRLGIMDTHEAVIFPAVFATFPVFLMYRSFLAVPEEVYEAFSLDGGNQFQAFYHIGVPLAMPGIKSAALLSMIECWNMVEQPLIFLKTPSLWPFSIYLPEIGDENLPYIFAFSLTALIPMALVAAQSGEEISRGIGRMAAVKE